MYIHTYLLSLRTPHVSIFLDLQLLPNTAIFGCAAVPTTPSQTGNNSLLQEDPDSDNQEDKISRCKVASLEEAYCRFVIFLYNNLSWKGPLEVWAGPISTSDPTSKYFQGHVLLSFEYLQERWSHYLWTLVSFSDHFYCNFFYFSDI